jgi:hypothetical protein
MYVIDLFYLYMKLIESDIAPPRHEHVILDFLDRGNNHTLTSQLKLDTWLCIREESASDVRYRIAGPLWSVVELWEDVRTTNPIR